MSEQFISPQTLKLLVDSKAESRQKGMREVLMKAIVVFREFPPDEAYAIITREMHEAESILLRTTIAAYRRGGLAVVRAFVHSLPAKTHPDGVIKYFTTIVFDCVADVDATVRLAAFEAAHVLVRQFKYQLLDICFVQVFSGIARGINDNDKKVAILAGEVSSLIREVVTNNDSFKINMDLFVTFITETLEPYSQATKDELFSDSPVLQWCLEWINYMLDLPGDELILLLWRFLKPLLILSGTRGGPLLIQVLKKCLRDMKDAFHRDVKMELPLLLSITTECVEESEFTTTKRISLQWILELFLIGSNELLHLIHTALNACMLQLGSKDLETRLAAQNVNNRLMQLVAITPKDDKVVSYDAVLRVVRDRLSGRGTEETRVASMEWITLVFQANPKVVENEFTVTFDMVLILLCDQSAHVLHKCIETLCLISGEKHFDYFIVQLIELIHAKADILLPKVPTIIKQLQLRYQEENLEQSEKLCLKLAGVLSQHEDKRFLEKMVITLSTLVLTSREFLPLREILHCGIHDKRAKHIFLGMYECWRYNPVAALSLCLLARVYEHAFQLIKLIGAAELSAATLLQIERLVRLLETPVFSYIRMEIMEPSKSLPLVQTLFAFQLILPQTSPQYQSLYRRLKTVPSLAILEREARIHDVENDDNQMMWNELLELSKEAQQCISEFERKLVLQRLGDNGFS
ncbi:HEAT repeat-containing protein [Trypanosoma theileri]|uniref:HEAT repeat-containing protein n=1 Tax=Trypanosoma theileri TaxID=67003 RepID=A0A1X0NNZ5_9TRYP|nr:HEAT repeat-containing protein [Trypanosoma theileri]ORC86228.1 HEAT repeat-containing protein [Trypanosoma theileri]